MKKLLSLTSAILLLTAAPAFAQVPAPFQRTITISGEAHEDVAPDQAVLSMSLVSKDRNLLVAKKNNDALVEKLVAITRGLDIPKEKVATSGVYIAPEYNYNSGQQQFVGYMVSRSFRVTMASTSLPEKLLSAIVDAKIDQVNGIDFQIANPEAHAAVLRIKAFEDAKTKAQALAQAAGSKLGQAISISTMDMGGARPPMPMMMAKASMVGESSVAPSLPGMITLSESVNVTFGLE